MIDELRAITAFAKGRCLHIDGLVFRLHSKLTTICILVALFIVSTSQFIGHPIYCDSHSLEISREMLDAFCYIHSTFTLKTNVSNGKSFEMKELYPGVGPEQDQEKRVKYYYYQWVWVIYFIQALCFYLPSWIWKNLEGGKMKALVKDIEILDVSCQLDKCDRIAGIANYLIHTFGSNDSYLWYYILCELGIFANLALQLYCLDLVFNGHYFTYGLDTLYYWDTDMNPLRVVSTESFLCTPAKLNSQMCRCFPK